MKGSAWLLAAAMALATAPAHAQSTRAERQQQEILWSLGGAYDGPQAAYVERVGERVAAAAGMEGRCVFTVVDSEVVNAFTAPPGCYVYVTRGLLGIMNSEAELAAVLGHELGHVAANHAIRQKNQENISGLAAAIVGVATKSDAVGKLANRVAKLGSLSYSRNQEYEADTLALRYLPSAGYAPEGLTRVLDDLQREDQFTARASGRPQDDDAPIWARTHPLTSERIDRVEAQVAKAPAPGGVTLSETTYLAAMDGLPYGDSPNQPALRGGAFFDPGRRIAFDPPRGFTLTSQLEAIQMLGPDGMLVEFAAGRATSRQLEGYAEGVLRGVIRQGRHEMGVPRRTTINGLEAVVLPARASSGGRPVDLIVVAYVVRGDEAYHFLAMAPAGQGSLYDPLFDSFRRLSDRELDATGGRRIAVTTVRAGDTPEALADRMTYERDRLGRFLMLNGLRDGEPLRPGSEVKLVVDGRR